MSSYIPLNIKRCFPANLKKSTVINIHKSGDISFAHNFRPISILTDIRKVFERVLYNIFCSYLSRSKILPDDTYGFRKSKSTTDGQLNQNQYLFDNIESGNSVFSLFLDYENCLIVLILTYYFLSFTFMVSKVYLMIY